LNPPGWNDRVRLITSLKKRDKTADVSSQVQAMLPLIPAKPGRFQELTNVFDSLGLRAESRAVLDAVCKRYPAILEANLELLRRHTETRDWTAAIAQGRKILDRHPDHPETLGRLV